MNNLTKLNELLSNHKSTIIDLYDKFKKGGSIHIKKKNRGTFTKYCNGKVTEDCIRKGKNSPDPKIRKKAVFADNSRKYFNQ